MAKRTIVADPVRSRIVDEIDADIEAARGLIQRANDLAALLNALDTSGEKIEIDGNVVVGVFKKEAEAK